MIFSYSSFVGTGSACEDYNLVRNRSKWKHVLHVRQHTWQQKITNVSKYRSILVETKEHEKFVLCFSFKNSILFLQNKSDL